MLTVCSTWCAPRLNVTGDATVSTVVAYHEGQLDEVVFNDPNADLDEATDDGKEAAV